MLHHPSSVSASYDVGAVCVSWAIAFFASYTALTLVHQISQSNGTAKRLWLMGGAVAIGSGIWGMHFVGMIAWCLPIPVKYNLLTVFGSLLAAIVASSVALIPLNPEGSRIVQLVTRGFSMGASIVIMHYSGMAAIRTNAVLEYNPWFVALSVGVAIASSCIALFIFNQINQTQATLDYTFKKLGSSILIGSAIPLTHYIGMRAVTVHLEENDVSTPLGADLSQLLILVSACVLVLLGIVLLLSQETSIFSLSQQVAERQRMENQLIQKTAQLTSTLSELQKMQVQMIQSEKMSSLGLLVAGVAHEINNPISFIHGNLSYLEDYTEQLLNVIQRCNQTSAPVADRQRLLMNDELEFIQEDLPNLIKSMRMGTARIREIVVSLRNFSRLDEAEFKEVNIHEGINSTLLILQHRLKATSKHPEIKVVRNYGELPLVDCYPGQLNQVFMHLLNNAIDALEQKRSTRPDAGWKATIAIQTEYLPQVHLSTSDISIRISDNGMGIPESAVKKIFDPFFTTKQIGKGSGMGLSISYKIITEKHRGTLKYLPSAEGGAEFVITIPTAVRVQLPDAA